MLYPPIIEGTLPSFWITEGQSTTIMVPFTMNQSVGSNEVSGFSLKIKSVISNDVILTINASSFNCADCKTYFKLTAQQTLLLNVGQFYKFQLAYLDKNSTVGYYSTVGVVKCTSQPTVYIDGLDVYATNSHRYTYTGYYINSEDNTEKVYSYRFILTKVDDDNNTIIVKDTGEIIHNTQTNVSDVESCDSFNIPFDLDDGEIYCLQYKITTNNHMEIYSTKYRIKQQELIDMEVPVSLDAELDYDNGYINIVINAEPQTVYTEAKTYDSNTNYYIKELDDDGDVKYTYLGTITETEFNTYESSAFFTKGTYNNYHMSGNFLLTKSSNLSNFKEWDKVATIKIAGLGQVSVERKDFDIQQGKTYIYALQQYNDYEMLSKRVCTEEIYADFEDAFLSDGDRQLRIRFNPKVSTFKTDRLEAKVDTIGSQYPFIFRNETVNYKEFSISGLLSYHSDENNLFMSDSELGLYPDTYKRRATIGNFDNNLKLQKSVINNYETKLYSEDEEWLEWRKQQTSAALTELEQQYEKAVAQYNQFYTANAETISLKQDLSNNYLKTTNFTDKSIAAERFFKLEVLDWLNNGQPKLFRSPGEGNYIVRLMNVSLSPEDNLGRMLHTFTATAYEVAECNYQNLIDLDIVRVDDLVFDHLLFKTIRLSESGYDDGTDYDPEEDGDSNPYMDSTGKMVKVFNGEVSYYKGEAIDSEHVCYSLLFTDMLPGTSITIDDQLIVIGNTGSYYAEYENGITSIYIDENNYYQGSLTYSYYGKMHLDFSLIRSQNVEEHACRQFIGNDEDIVSSLSDIKTELQKFFYLDFYKRPILDVNYAQYEVYVDEDDEEVLFLDDFEDNTYFIKNDYSNYKLFNLDEAFKTTEIYSSSLTSDQETLLKENLILSTTFYKTRFGEDEFTFLNNSEKDNYTLKLKEKFQYYSLIENTNYFKTLNKLYLYRFTSNIILDDGELVSLSNAIEIYKDIANDKYLVDESIYNTLKDEEKKYFSIYNTKVSLNGRYILASDDHTHRQSNTTYYILQDGEYVVAEPTTAVGELWSLNDKQKTFDKINQIYIYPLKYYIYKTPDISIDLSIDEQYSIPNIDTIDIYTIPIPNGVYLNAGYQTIVIEYDIENTSQDTPFLKYKDVYEYYKTAIQRNDTYEDEILDTQPDNMKSLLNKNQQNLTEALESVESGLITNEQYDEIVAQYLEFLEMYEQYLNGEIDLTLTTLTEENYAALERLAVEVLAQLDEARENYYEAYNKYITRLEWLIQKYREEGDYAYDY